jgi:hypothetical protein
MLELAALSQCPLSTQTEVRSPDFSIRPILSREPRHKAVWRLT